ncbi:DUF89 family protein [Candidatus Micrarchaeota archaeon]|nr:DUF89 family protein [Candidatus Micrarchaeota archaeon]
MRIKPRCASCLLRIYTDEAAIATSDKETREKIIRELCHHLAKNFSFDRSEYAELAATLDGIVKKHSGNPDPYKKAKEETSEKALETAKGLPEAEDVKQALRVALAGNAIDFSFTKPNEAVDAAKKAFEEKLAIDESDQAAELIEKAERIVYVTDNSGELYFDKMLIKKLKEKGKFVRVIVREKPLLNDATLADLKKAGIAKIVDEVVEYPVFGYQEPDEGLVIAKGQVAYITTCEANPKEAVFVLKVKCEAIAEALNVKPMSLVIKVKKEA